MKTFPPGTILFDKYEVINIFHGAMGVVYAAVNLNRKDYFELPFVCLKTYIQGIIPDEDRARELFIQEVENWMSLGEYDLILNAYKIRFIDERPYVFLQYADHGTLLDLSKQNYNPIDDLKDNARSLSWLWQFAAALKNIYSSIDRCHGDLHLGNVFLANSGMLLKIGDFGLTALKHNSDLASAKDEKVNIVKILWFLLTGSNDDYFSIKESYKTSIIPNVYRQIISDYIECDDISLSRLIDNHLKLHREYVCSETGVMPLLPEEHHANVMKRKEKLMNDLLSGINARVTYSEHIQRPIHYLDESEALFWTGNKEESLNRFLKFLKHYHKHADNTDE